tara:strand:- start:25 stop:357 length:333 start_codon:yes stop_codon:yes gene_type:complete
MSEKNYADDDPERTLVTLDQLSQTIEVMTSVVNRLRRHLSDQIKAQLDAQEEIGAVPSADSPTTPAEKGSATEPKIADSQQLKGGKRESFVVEINQQEIEPTRKSTKVLH